MSNKPGNALHTIFTIDGLARRDVAINRIHPLSKFLVTVGYIATVVSCNKYDIAGVSSLFIYPFVLFLWAELPFADALRRMRLVLPLIVFIGILNPLLDPNRIVIAGHVVSAGVFSFITLVIKGILSLLASYLLIATTTIEGICYALQCLHFPKILVTQFMLTYRYISVLMEEVHHSILAYQLRAPRQKGVHHKVWGSLAGQLLLRAIDRASVVYESMVLRGYTGDFSYLQNSVHATLRDFLYVFVCTVFCITCRFLPIFELIGSIFVHFHLK